MFKALIKKSISILMLLITFCFLFLATTSPPTEALSTNAPANMLQLISGYNGSSNKYMIPKGYRGIIEAYNTSNGLDPNIRWIIERAPNSKPGYVFRANNGYYLNYTRTVTNGNYNHATMFSYEYNRNGADQRVAFTGVGTSGSYYIRLVEKPVQLHNNDVYLMCDKSSPSSTTVVLWYTYTSANRAIWC